MRPQKSQKIDLNTEYPCPCRRRGRLLPITLTEAFGCDRCQQIFVLEDNSQVIEQLSSSYPYKRAWRWSGNRWLAIHPGLGEGSLYLGWALSVLLIICLTLVLQLFPGSMIFWAMMALLLVVLSTLILWFAYRR
ncbi:MAG: hypothetical protein ACREPR_27180 [Brasilonema sp.]